MGAHTIISTATSNFLSLQYLQDGCYVQYCRSAGRLSLAGHGHAWCSFWYPLGHDKRRQLKEVDDTSDQRFKQGRGEVHSRVFATSRARRQANKVSGKEAH